MHVFIGAIVQFREQFRAPDRRFEYTVVTKYLFGNEPIGGAMISARKIVKLSDLYDEVTVPGDTRDDM